MPSLLWGEYHSLSIAVAQCRNHNKAVQSLELSLPSPRLLDGIEPLHIEQETPTHMSDNHAQVIENRKGTATTSDIRW